MCQFCTLKKKLEKIHGNKTNKILEDLKASKIKTRDELEKRIIKINRFLDGYN